MVNNGYEDVVNIDISSVVIEAMQKKYINHPRLKCILRPFNIFRSASVLSEFMFYSLGILRKDDLSVPLPLTVK